MAKNEKLFIQPYEIEVHYKKMKNIYLKVKSNGQLTISAPNGTSKKYLTEFVLSRKSWIEEKQQQMAKLQATSPALKENEILLFGQPHDEKPSAAALQKLLHEKITHYYEKYWPFFASESCEQVEIKYRMMKLTWGVCRPVSKTITFNKRLIHQPVEFIEYVVLHEMCHLLIPNHSKDFYHLLASHMPNFKQNENARMMIYEK